MKLICLILIVLSLNIFAEEKAQVIIVKGKVTKLEPRAHDAKNVSKGDWLLQDTSLVTGDKSFAKVRFLDGSIMNVGPKSMVVINKMPKEKANMVNLLTGMIKAEVQKDQKKKAKTKMLVRTRSAVMGVRGTKFQTSYNHANKRTTLVTVEGEVAMAKKIKKEEVVEAKQVSEKVETINDANPEGLDELEKVFEDEAQDIVEVSEGEFAGVAESIEKPTEPIKIAPEQYNALAKSFDSKKRAEDVYKPESKENAEASYDEKTGKIKPRSGGFVDFTTGLYVAPTPDAEFDESTGTFKADKVGSIDEKTADYVPPKGIKVDAKKGFIVDQKELATLSSKEDKEALQKTLLAMNQDVKEQVTTIEQIEMEKEKLEEKPTRSWGPDKHLISLMVRPYSEEIKATNEISNDDETIHSEKANWTILTWEQVWNEKWHSRLRIGWQDYEIEEDGFEVKTYDEENKDDGYFSLGLGHRYNNKWMFYFDIVKRNEVLPIPEQNKDIRRDNEEFDYIDLSALYSLGNWKNFETSLLGTLHLPAGRRKSSSLGNDRIDTEASGISFEANGLYRFNERFGLNSGIVYRRLTVKNDDLSFIKSELGLGFNLIYQL